MKLSLHETIHFALSILSALICWFMINGLNLTFSNLFYINLSVGILGGLLIDIDHLFDYWKTFKFNFKKEYFLKGAEFTISDRIYELFHGYEISLILIFLSLFLNQPEKIYVFTLGLSSLVHLLTDVFINKMPLKSYSLFYRIIHQFKLKDLVYPEHYQKH